MQARVQLDQAGEACSGGTGDLRDHGPTVAGTYEGLGWVVWDGFGALLYHHSPRGGSHGLPGIYGTRGDQRWSPILRLYASPLRTPLRLR